MALNFLPALFHPILLGGAVFGPPGVVPSSPLDPHGPGESVTALLPMVSDWLGKIMLGCVKSLPRNASSFFKGAVSSCKVAIGIRLAVENKFKEVIAVLVPASGDFDLLRVRFHAPTLLPSRPE